MSPIRILGVDPGSCVCGVGIIDYDTRSKRSFFVHAQNIRMISKEMPYRLAQLHATLTEIVQTFQPHEFVVEQIFVHRNNDSALKLAQARGVAIAAVVAGGLPIFEYTARQVKQAVTGYGQAEKSQVSHMVKALLNIQTKISKDAADALAIALSHAFYDRKQPPKVSKQKRSRRIDWSQYDSQFARKTS